MPADDPRCCNESGSAFCQSTLNVFSATKCIFWFIIRSTESHKLYSEKNENMKEYSSCQCKTPKFYPHVIFHSPILHAPLQQKGETWPPLWQTLKKWWVTILRSGGNGSLALTVAKIQEWLMKTNFSWQLKWLKPEGLFAVSLNCSRNKAATKLRTKIALVVEENCIKMQMYSC